MGVLVRLTASVLHALGRLAAGEPPRCTYPGCPDAALHADLDGGPGGQCDRHVGVFQ